MNAKQIKDLSRYNRQQIEEKLDNLGRASGDREIIAKIVELKRALEAQAASADPEISRIDDDISTVLADAQKDISSGHGLLIGARLDKLGGLIRQRAQVCPENSLPGTKREEKQKEKMEKMRVKMRAKRAKDIARRKKRGEPVADLYSPEELLDNMLQLAIDEKLAQTNKLQELHDRLVKNPNDQYAKALWMPTKIKIQEKEQFINAYGNELQRSTLIASMGSVNAGLKELIANRKVDDSQFQMMMQDFAKSGVEFSADQQKVSEGVNMFMSQGMAQTAAADATLGQAGFNAFSTPAQGTFTGGMGQAAPAGQAVDPILNDPDFIALGGGASPSQSRLEEAFEDVDQFLAGLNTVIKRLDNEIDKLESKRQDVASELKELLRRRKSVNADECPALDAQIDRLANEHKSIERSIATMKQRSAMCIEKRSIASSISDLKKAGDMDKYINDLTGDKFKDLSDLALDIKNTYEAANQELEDLGVMNQVASPEINSSTMMGTTNAMQLENVEKDDDKYAEMEKKFGLR